MLYTILQIIAFQALFLLVYDLFLKRETFFNYNRAYLLFTSVLSLVLPFIKFPELKQIATKDLVIQLPEVFIGTKTLTKSEMQIAEYAGITIESPQTPIWQSIIIGGIIVATLFFISKIAKLYWLKYKNPKRWKGNVLIVNLIKSSAAFSFFNTIFIGERIPETEKPTIYKHELVHIKELHTLDLLFFELLRIVFWFNPLVYIYQNRIKELHEYIADAKAVKQNGKADYYQSLLNQVFDVNNVSFTNTFFKKSLIKKRIAMLQKSKSKQLNLLKYALLIPMVFGMLIYTSTEVRAQEKAKQEKTVDQELTDEQLVKKYYDEFVEMDKDGSTITELMTEINFNRNNKYIESREDYLKFIAFGQYLVQWSVEMKSEKGTLTQRDVDSAEEMKSKKYKTYKEYREWKNSKEAKQQWVSNTQGGILKLFVEDAGNKTKEEEKRFDALMKKLEKDTYYRKLIVTDGQSTLVIDSPNGPDDSVIEIHEIDESIEVPFSVIEEVPTLEECKDLITNDERKHCMTNFVNKHVGKNFNTKIAENLSPGKKRIFVQFKVDTEGNVKDIKARGPSKELEDEAERVLKMLPQFVPGKQKGKLVTVPYSLPIVFEVKGNTSNSKTNSDEKAIDNTSIDNLKTETKHEIEPWSTVDVAPVHPDCTTLSLELEKKECTSAVINKHMAKNFNMDLAKSLGLSDGKKRIFTQFRINKDGNVTNILSRAPHPKLEEEAARVLELLPKFIPGKRDGNVVDVAFSLPIVFQIVDTKKDQN